MGTIEWTKIHERRTFSIVTPILALLSVLYGLGVRLRVIAYKVIKRRSLPGFVVSIGNLTAGGTGKTPAACMLAEWASGEGYAVAILSRGYGGQYGTATLEVSNGHTILASPTAAGDEPYLLAKRLSGVPVILSKKRYLGGLLAHQKFKTHFYILDDGFQHLNLKRDLDLVLMDASNPFGNGHLLPWGPLRESINELKRADAFIITRSGMDASRGDLKGFLKKKFPGKPIFSSDHTPEHIVLPNKNRIYPSHVIKGKRVVAFAGIARPEAFEKILIHLGAHVVFFRAFKDHHNFLPDEIEDLIMRKESFKADYLITTEKDWVRLETLRPEYADLAYLTIRFEMLLGREAFFRMVKEKLAQTGVGEFGVRHVRTKTGE